ncbi:MAG: hypothetical protein ACRCZA_04515 [Shewanella sp.]|uniref:hypothetical protein n=1 Tax=Shewanella sp. TaxID=50422 RepID=UPI003F3EAB7A
MSQIQQDSYFSFRKNLTELFFYKLSPQGQCIMWWQAYRESEVKGMSTAAVEMCSVIDLLSKSDNSIAANVGLERYCSQP